MAYPKKISDEKLLSDYKRLNNVWKVASENNMCGQSVHERLVKLKAIDKTHRNSDNVFSDWDILKKEYPLAVTQKGGLEKLALRLGRTKSFICRKAKEIGLTDINRVKQEHISKISSDRFKSLMNKDHPKGMLGKKHSKETLETLSAKSKMLWEDKSSYLNSEEYRQKLSDRMSKIQSKRPPSNPYSRAKSGYATIADKRYFFRSSWEANIAAYFQFLKQSNEINEWEYEPDTFWFEKIKRGVRSYKPDFKITKNDGSQYYVEVKGWMDDKSKTKLKRMSIYYPKIKIELIDSMRYNQIKKTSGIYEYWGQLQTKR